MAKSKAKKSKKAGTNKVQVQNDTAQTPKSTKPDFTAEDVMAKNLGTKTPKWIYAAAFLIPAVITLIAYAAFGMFPFGDRSVLALDLNGQYIYYFERLRDVFWGEGSIFYSWARDLSGEYMGIIGYYLASPFTLIVMLLPRTMIIESVMIMQLCKIGAAGLTFCIYAQRSKKIKPLQSLLFSTAYAMMGYVVIQTIDPMWLDGAVFLPLIALGIEYLLLLLSLLRYGEKIQKQFRICRRCGKNGSGYSSRPYVQRYYAFACL